MCFFYIQLFRPEAPPSEGPQYVNKAFSAYRGIYIEKEDLQMELNKLVRALKELHYLLLLSLSAATAQSPSRTRKRFAAANKHRPRREHVARGRAASSSPLVPPDPTGSSLAPTEKGEERKWKTADGAAAGQRVGAPAAEDRDGDQPRYR